MARAQVQVQVRTTEFARLAADLRRAGATTLRRELLDALRRSTAPAIQAARARALSELPRRGGLGTRVASARITARFRGGRNPAVLIEARDTRGMDLDAIDRGKVWHPWFGHRRHWSQQTVNPRWMTGAIAKRERAIRRELDAAIANVAREIGN